RVELLEKSGHLHDEEAYLFTGTGSRRGSGPRRVEVTIQAGRLSDDGSVCAVAPPAGRSASVTRSEEIWVGCSGFAAWESACISLISDLKIRIDLPSERAA